jgi:hypothetical protein
MIRTESDMTSHQLKKLAECIVGRSLDLKRGESVTKFLYQGDLDTLTVLVRVERTEPINRHRTLIHKGHRLEVWGVMDCAWVLLHSLQTMSEAPDTVLSFYAPTRQETAERREWIKLGRPYDASGYRRSAPSAERTASI